MSTINELYMGWASSDITPEGPVSLFGQYYERISTHVQSALTATAWALEAPGAGHDGQAILISLDLLWCTTALQEAVRASVSKQLPDFDPRKLLIFATHTHSGPEPRADDEYGRFLVARLTETAVAAWQRRSPSHGVTPATTYAPIGHNRRVQYADGTTEMYGAVDREDFIGLEGPEDASMDLLFCWGPNNQLEGIVINVPCPAQVTEAKYYVSADYWNEVRRRLRERFSPDLFILAQCGAAGDISPRDLPRGYSTEAPNMWEWEGAAEIGRRIERAVSDAYDQVRDTRERHPVFRHLVEDVDLPLRNVTHEAYEQARRIVEEIRSREPADPASPQTAWNRFLAEIKANEKTKSHGPWDNKKSDYGVLRKMELEMEQYDSHPKKQYYRTEIHVVRLGSVVFASNPFELFVDYGLIIKGRSVFNRTLLIQLSGDYADYLPTPRALAGGGYSAMATAVGPEGGYLLVEKTLALINEVN
ncbi:hypothetical protein [Parapedobacter indicus]|uniref:Neutral/alkaline non-lysosomal ceramidase, N-terminal n=1 Tax=Parapedobacter indicus TaxID=1477437 RepID=A0A1I3HPF7_9SPHI|nr:hypothetical protein [Parapedobacter indicus]PPL03119.1 hypothetical protein CLV26_103445 [Parapedobacter indicus]SFI37615.1 hypothetical protein SAMN05444682_103444 [Parapedobacter indicus]